jgi:hypothetical protein
MKILLVTLVFISIICYFAIKEKYSIQKLTTLNKGNNILKNIISDTNSNNYLWDIIKKLHKIKLQKVKGIDYASITKIINFSDNSIGFNAKEMYKYDTSNIPKYSNFCKQYPKNILCKKPFDCKKNNLTPGCQSKETLDKLKDLIKRKIVKNNKNINIDLLLSNSNISFLLNVLLSNLTTVEQILRILSYLSSDKDRWQTGTNLLNSRVKIENAYYGDWSVSTIVRDSEYDMFGNDMYGLLSIGDNNSHISITGRYIFAGWENRMDLINTRRSQNLGFGLVRNTTLDYGPECVNDNTEDYGEFGQGTEVRPKNGNLWTCFPIKNCPGNNNKTIISFRKGTLTQKISPSSIRVENQSFLTNHTIIKNENGDIISYGVLDTKSDWIAYDTIGEFICVPNDLELDYLDIYKYEHDELDNFILQKVNRARFWQGNTDVNEGLAGDGAQITAGTFGNDGLLYLLCDDSPIRWPYLSSFRGILVYRPIVLENGDWKLVLVRKISFDVEGQLVGLTKVDSPDFVNISRTPLLIAMELNDDIFTLDNISLHQITPTDVVCNTGRNVDRCSFGTFLDSESIFEDWECGLGIVTYNIFRSINYISTKNETPYTLKRTDARSMQLFSGFRDYLEQVLQLNQDIDLDRVEIYDDMCIVANWGREHQTARAMCMGYTIYFQSKITRTKNDVTKLRGEFLNTLIHELTHTRQFVQLGESHYNFGCSYGIGVCDSIEVSGTSYAQVYMEEEARYVYELYLINDSIATQYNMNIWPNSFNMSVAANC